MRPAVSSENLITASGVAPLEFTMEVLRKLDVFAPDTLHAWFDTSTAEAVGFLGAPIYRQDRFQA
ncbi:hypothetical protein SAMN05444487_111148 [Marininema mesophilum]|uniref:Uncharacterized protein n=1 Tax=Marininema mesophilum TaxID=1048340 RepID=A0A1H2ZQW5_9BACL|nr:hypothetical protein SAMN05444487_111148 [Marininema mesophilum]